MPIRSMTGFGRAAVELSGVSHTVEIRSVNHRYLDVRVRLPRSLAGAEADVRARVGEVAQRGRVEVNVQSATDESAGSAVAVNAPLARAVVEAARRLAEQYDLPDDLGARDLALWPGVLQPVSAEVEPEALEAALLPGLDRALAALVVMREREGRSLETELRARLAKVAELRDAIERHVPEQAEAYRRRLEGRLRELLAELDQQVDASRVVHEVGVFAEKADVAEELTRLGSHLEQATALLEAEASAVVGRRLDFLCQEMFREANTVASKAQLLRVSELAIELKAELERLREQVQNVE